MKFFLLTAAILTVVSAVASTAHAAGNEFRIGGSVDIGNEMTGQLFAAAGTANIEGRINGGANIVAGRINIAGTVQDDVLAVSGAFTLWPIGQIGGDLHLASGDAEVSGAVGGDLVVAAGSVIVAGQVGGDIRTMAGKVTVLPGAVIGGRIITRGPGTVEVSPDAQVLGGLAPEPPQRHRENRSLPQTLIGGTIMFALLQLPVVGLGTLMVGLLFLAIFPRFAESAASIARTQIGLSVVAGFLTLAAAPVTVGVLAFTILGLPLAVLTAAVLVLLLVVSYGVGTVTLTSAIWQRFRVGVASGLSLPERFWWRALYLCIGLAVLGFLRHVPVAGPIALWGPTLVGLGALIIEMWRRWRRPAVL